MSDIGQSRLNAGSMTPVASQSGEADDSFVLPASFAQRRIWLAEKLHSCGNFYNIGWGLRGQAPLDHAVMEKVFNEMVRRHESLRTHFVETGGEPQQAIDRELEVHIPVADLSSFSEDRARSEADALIRANCGTPFDLSGTTLCRALLVRMPMEYKLLLFCMHHAVFDGWSQEIFLREAAVLQNAFAHGRPSPLEPLHIQYADYTIWQREQLGSARLKGQLEYWKKQLGSIQPVRLPGDRSRNMIGCSPAGIVRFSFGRDLCTKLKEIGQSESATLFMVLLAVWQTLLFRITGQFDISVGSTVAGRNRPEIKGLIGCFTNNLILRSNFSDHPTFLQMLRQVRRTTIDAYENQDVPFEIVADALAPDRDQGSVPLYHIGFVMHNLPNTRLQMDGADLEYMGFDNDLARVDLHIAMAGNEQGISGNAKYSRAVFDEVTIKTLFCQFETLLRSVIERPNEYVSRLRIEQ